jgi:hypothetical protein
MEQNLPGQPVGFSLQNERGDLTLPSRHAHTIKFRGQSDQIVSDVLATYSGNSARTVMPRVESVCRP